MKPNDNQTPAANTRRYNMEKQCSMSKLKTPSMMATTRLWMKLYKQIPSQNRTDTKRYVNSLTCFKLTPLMLSLLPWSADHSSGLTGGAFSPTMVCPSWQFSQWALSRPWFVVSTLQLNWNSFWGPRSLSASLPPLFCGPADSSRAMLCYAYPGYGTPTTPLPRLLPCPGINKPVSTTQKNLLVVMGMCLGMQMNGMMSLLFLIWKFLALFHIISNTS